LLALLVRQARPNWVHRAPSLKWYRRQSAYWKTALATSLLRQSGCL